MESEKKELLYIWLKSRFNQYLSILEVISERINEDKVAKITQNDIARLLNISPTNVSKKLKRLKDCKAIEKLAPGEYLLLQTDINFTPYKSTRMVLDLFFEQPEIFRDYKNQAEILNLGLNEIQQAWGVLLADNKLFIK